MYLAPPPSWAAFVQKLAAKGGQGATQSVAPPSTSLRKVYERQATVRVNHYVFAVDQSDYSTVLLQSVVFFVLFIFKSNLLHSSYINFVLLREPVLLQMVFLPLWTYGMPFQFHIQWRIQGGQGANCPPFFSCSLLIMLLGTSNFFLLASLATIPPTYNDTKLF